MLALPVPKLLLATSLNVLNALENPGPSYKCIPRSYMSSNKLFVTFIPRGPITLGALPDLFSPILKPLNAVRNSHPLKVMLFISWSALTRKLAPLKLQPTQWMCSVWRVALLSNLNAV